MTRAEALVIWRSMSVSDQEKLWAHNCDNSNDFTRTWTFGMFRASTSVMWKAMCRFHGEEMVGR